MCRSALIVGVAAGLAAAALPAAAAGSVEVTWLQSDRYSDAGRSIIDRERTMKSLSDYMAQLGRQLPDGQALKIEVLDVDLAGEVEPHGWHEVRILRGRADWPHMTLRYTLQARGQTLKAGEARLTDMNYLFARRGYGTQGTDLPFEKRMLAEWFGETFPAH